MAESAVAPKVCAVRMKGSEQVSSTSSSERAECKAFLGVEDFENPKNRQMLRNPSISKLKLR
jgi:hypothetical protein